MDVDIRIGCLGRFNDLMTIGRVLHSSASVVAAM
jgi:hypothetical protein